MLLTLENMSVYFLRNRSRLRRESEGGSVGREPQKVPYESRERKGLVCMLKKLLARLMSMKNKATMLKIVLIRLLPGLEMFGRTSGGDIAYR
jgi:hypothetical protein